MNAVEKKMFFIPNRLFAAGKELFVSFNIADIPVDMEVTFMTLAVPLPDRREPLQVTVHALDSGWDEEWIKTYRPLIGRLERDITVPAHRREVDVTVTRHRREWRSNSLENHGLAIRLHSEEAIGFSDQYPPYLIIGTE